MPISTFVGRANRTVQRALVPVKEWRYLAKYPTAAPGSVPWLVGTEIKYVGLQTRVPRNKVSPNDPRTAEELARGGMIGGDRMLHHGYGPRYAKHLRPFVGAERRLTIAEFGVLRGTGLAVWCDLFPGARIIGFDIDLNHFQRNRADLEQRGAFARNEPELHEYDQFIDNTEYLGTVLGGDRIDICIDDGYHSVETILMTLKSVTPYLAERFVYFIEDNDHVIPEIQGAYPEFRVEGAGELTVAWR